MKRFIREYPLAMALILLLAVANVLGWGALYSYRAEVPDDTKLYGTFGTDRLVDQAVFLTFEDDVFYLYRGGSEDFLDQGSWTQSGSTAVLTGGSNVYDLVIKGDSLYLTGGAFDRLTRYLKMEHDPVLIGGRET